MRVGVAGLGSHGGGDRGPSDGCRARGHRLEPHGRQGEAARRRRRQGGRHARPSLRSQVEAIVTILTNREAIAAVYDGAVGPARRQRQGQARHRHEHGAAGDRRWRWPRRCGPRAPPSSNARSAARSGRRATASCWAWPAARRRTSRAPSRCSRRCAGASSTWGPVGAGASMKLALNLPLMIYYQAHGRGLRALPAPEARSQVADGADVRHLGRAQRAQERAAPRSPRRWPAAMAVPPAFDVDSIRKDLATMVAEGRARARACRWWRGRSPSSMRPPRTAGASATAPRCRPTGRCADRGPGRNAD